MTMKMAWLVVAGLLLSGCGTGEARDRTEPMEGDRSADSVAREATRPAAGDEVPGPAGGPSDGPERHLPGVDGGSAPNRSAPNRPAPDGLEPASDPESTPESDGTGERRAEEPAEEPADGHAHDGTGAEEADAGRAEASPEEVLRATSQAYEELRAFRAEFEQTLRNTLLGRTTTSRGTLYQRQPDRFLMAFSEPAEDLIVSDGEWFWMYFPSVDEKQVIRTRRGSQGLDLHAQFIGDPVERFETTYHGTAEVRGRRAHVMTLDPRQAAGYERLKVWIDAEDHLVRRFELTESNGNEREFVLWDMERNPTLSDDLFDFTPPAGAQVVTR